MAPRKRQAHRSAAAQAALSQPPPQEAELRKPDTSPSDPLFLVKAISVIGTQFVFVAFCLFVLPADTYQVPKSVAALLAPLIRDPTFSLLQASGGLLLVQTWFSYAILSRLAVPDSSDEPPKVDIFKAIYTGAKGSAIFAVVFHVASVLLGAPFARRAPATLLLSLINALLAVFPVMFTLGDLSRLHWQRFVTFPDRFLTKRELLLRYAAGGTLLGCWASAAVYPLDWERPWQAWPVPCVIGTYAGHVLGSLLGLGACALHTQNH